jgi:acyl-CoA thioester hydrolase
MTTAVPFSCPVRVQYDDTDAQGRVFYANYFPLLDQARCAFWESLGLTIAEVVQVEHDTVIVHLEADYHGPAGFYDRLHIAVQPQALGRSSLHLLYHVLHEHTGQEILTARMVMVQVDLASATSRPWSAAFRDAIIRHAGPHIIKREKSEG